MNLRITCLFITILSIHTCYGQFELNGRELAPYQLVSGKATQIELTTYALNAVRDTFEIRYRDNAIKAQFNSSGLLVKEVIDLLTPSIKTSIKEYEGKLLKKEYRLSNNDLYETILYDYIGVNKKKSALATDAQGLKSYMTSYTYQGDTVVTEETFYYARNITRKEEYHYNEKNKLTQHCTYDSKGEKTKCQTFSYDNTGKLIAETYAISREHTLEIAHKKKLYYQNNYLTREEVYAEALEKWVPINYKYSFDNNGNWTSILYYTNGLPDYYITRKITY